MTKEFPETGQQMEQENLSHRFDLWEQIDPPDSPQQIEIRYEG